VAHPRLGARRPDAGAGAAARPADETRALTRNQVAALLTLTSFRLPADPPRRAGLPVTLRERTYWRLLYETAVCAEELLGLDVADLDLANERARVVSKGGKLEWVHYQSGAAQLLPRLLAGRKRGPVFLADRKAPARTPSLDVCPVTGRARLSYRRAAELFTAATAQLDPDGGGWTLHQLRHSALTHEAEEGTSTPMLLSRSRHASVRSLERYARPSAEAVARHVAARDPAARRRRAR
jgi:integrase/recombinase XerD